MSAEDHRPDCLKRSTLDASDHVGDDTAATTHQPFSLTSMPGNPFGLKVREQVFVDRYLLTFNASQAYAAAGYKPGRHNAARLLRKPRVQRAIQASLAPVMSGQEALARLSTHARADIRKLFPQNSAIATLPDDVALTVKAVWPTKYGYRIETYDAQRASELLAKSAGVLKETVKVERSLEEIMARANTPSADE